MGETKEIRYTIRLGDMFSGTIDKAGEHVKKFEGHVEHAKERITEMGRELLGAFVAFEAGEFLKSSAEAFIESEKNARQLQLAVGASGGLASDYKELIAQAKELQEKGIFGKEDIISADRLGLQMGLTADKVKELTPLLLNVAAGTNKPIQEIEEAILHGAQGMERGLVQFGIHIKDTGSKTKNLALIVEQLRHTYKNTNEEIAKYLKCKPCFAD